MPNPESKKQNKLESFIPLQNLPLMADMPSQQAWYMEGAKHGCFSSSVLIAEVEPGAGSPLHLHYTEEVQVLPECRAEFIVGEEHFTIEGPGVVTIPAKTPHTFINSGDRSFVLEALNHYQRNDNKTVTVKAVAITDRNERGLVTSSRLYSDITFLFA